jgi:hypothetical protein
VANNNLQTSFCFDCGSHEDAGRLIGWIDENVADKAWPKELKDRLVAAVGESAADYSIAYATYASQPEGSEVWVHIDEGGDLEMLAVILGYAMEQFKDAPSPQGFTWAETCSQPRVDEFSGGACLITRGKPTQWLHTTDWLDKQRKRRVEEAAP